MPKYRRLRQRKTLDNTPLLNPESEWFVYVLTSPRSTIPYIGKSNNLERRLRQHNGELVGGARRTRKNAGCWVRELHISGFPDERAALQFEWRFQRERKNGPTGKKVSPLDKAIRALRIVLTLRQTTKTAVPFSTYTKQLTVHCETETARTLLGSCF